MIKIPVKAKIHQLAERNHGHIEKVRLYSEIGGCVFVALETHYVLFVLLLSVWAVADVFKLFDD